jgi:hypothetical protein
VIPLTYWPDWQIWGAHWVAPTVWTNEHDKHDTLFQSGWYDPTEHDVHDVEPIVDAYVPIYHN